MLHFGKIPKKFGQIWRKFSKILAKFAKFWKKIAKNSAIFNENFAIRERCKGVHLGESFPTRIYLQKSASIRPRTSPSKFGGKFNSVFTSLLSREWVGFVARHHCMSSTRGRTAAIVAVPVLAISNASSRSDVFHVVGFVFVFQFVSALFMTVSQPRCA